VVRFFTYHQNNTGGSFQYDDERGIAEYVIVEAENAHKADERAKNIGLYFGGEGDCCCCGDRWEPFYDDKYAESGDDEPSLYGDPILENRYLYVWRREGPQAYIHYDGGDIVGLTVRKAWT
jgi:hypothetical protein